LPEPAIRNVADRLGMAYIRVYEIATFYTQFQLQPVGKKAHVQVCGTTPCMLRGAEALKEVCRNRIHHDQHHLSVDGNFSWEEVECAGACANAPMVQIFADTYEDLTPDLLEKVLDGYAAGKILKTGSQIGRKASAPMGGASTLKDPSLYDGSVVGSWRQRFAEAEAATKAAAAAPTPTPGASGTAPTAKSVTSGAASPTASVGGSAGAAVVGASAAAGVTAGAAATAAVGLMSGAAPGGKVVSPPPPIGTPPTAAAKSSVATAGPGVRPPALAAPRGGKGDDLKLLWGVADKLEAKLNASGTSTRSPNGRRSSACGSRPISRACMGGSIATAGSSRRASSQPAGGRTRPTSTANGPRFDPRQALALGRLETSAYQRARLVRCSGRWMRAARMKSIAHKAVTSAIE
jgi:NADH-quinone oxidoreductase subunit E